MQGWVSVLADRYTKHGYSGEFWRVDDFESIYRERFITHLSEREAFAKEHILVGTLGQVENKIGSQDEITEIYLRRRVIDATVLRLKFKLFSFLSCVCV